MDDVASALTGLHEHLARALSANPAGIGSFDALAAQCSPRWEEPRFLNAFTAAARALGRGPLGADATSVAGPAGPVTLAGLSCDVAGRVLLLTRLAQEAPAQLTAACLAAYREGDTREKIAVVRALPLLPDAERFVEIALDAGRTNELDLFRSLACDNPFPARHYDELAWNKLYMKAAFVGLPLERMQGFAARENAELSRMALHYIEQQESAGRSFPLHLWLAIAAFPPPGAVAKLLGYASHAVPEQRLGAAHGLARAKQARVESFVRERLAIEPDAHVLAALQAALNALTQCGDHAPRASQGVVR
jgi:hypothetical protein